MHIDRNIPNYKMGIVIKVLSKGTCINHPFARQFFDTILPCNCLHKIWAHLYLSKTIMSTCNLTLRRLMSYIYGAPILDVSRSHTTTQHSR